MKKITTKFLLALILLIGMQKVNGQMVSSYSFSSTASTYTTIAGGTVLGNNSNDDDVFDNVPIGFTFNFDGVNFTQLSVCANGYIKPGTLLNFFSYNPISDNFADDTIISAMGYDLQSLNNGTLRYRTNGASPNRVFIVQWKNYTTFANNDTMNFQIRLHETSNIIDVYYGGYYVDVNNTFEVGLRGILASNDFNNRSVINSTNTWATSVAGTQPFDYCELDPSSQFAPVSGQKYSWGPPPPCVGTPTAGIAISTATMACVGQVYNLNLSGSTIASGLTYQWQSSPNNTAWTSVPSATNMGYNPTFSSPIYYRCIVACTTNTAVSTSIQIISQTANVYAIVPFLENFDNTWQNRCDLRNVPVSANWASNPTTGDNSWRRQDDGVSANWSSSSTTVTPLAGIGSADFDTYDASYGTTGNMDLYVNLGSTSNYQLSFYHINNDGDDSLQVLLSTNGGMTFTADTTFYSGDYSAVDANWNKKIIQLGAVNSSSCVIRFLATSDFGISDIGMDSLQIKTACAAPILTLTASQATVCNGIATNLTASGAVTYTWNTTATTASISVTPSITSTYTVTGENTPGCPSIKTITITVKPSPVLSFSVSPSATICPGGSANLTVSGASNYTWAAGNQTTSAISVTPAISTVYNVVGTNSVGCSTNTSVTVFVVFCTGFANQTGSLNNINVYPNPSGGEFVIELLNGSNKFIEIMDVTGRIIRSLNTTEDKVNMDIKGLANGVYYLRVQSNNTVNVQKIIKE